MPFDPTEITNPKKTLARQERQAMPDADQDTDPPTPKVVDETTKRSAGGTMSQAQFSGYPSSRRGPTVPPASMLKNR